MNLVFQKGGIIIWAFIGCVLDWILFYFQLSYLSVECIPFGHVPLYAVSHRIFFLHNSSTDHIISFRWVLEGSAAEQVLLKQICSFTVYCIYLFTEWQFCCCSWCFCFFEGGNDWARSWLSEATTKCSSQGLFNFFFAWTDMFTSVLI